MADDIVNELHKLADVVVKQLDKLAHVFVNKQLIFKNYVEGEPKESDFYIRTSKIKIEMPIGKPAVFLENLYLAVDPFLRHRMSPNDHGDGIDLLVPFKPGEVIAGFGVARVLLSTHPNFIVGEYVWGVTGWENYSMVIDPDTLFKIFDFRSIINDPSILFKIEPSDTIPLSYYAEILGMVGLTAYVGIFNVLPINEGDVVYVSTAAGGVGQLAGQFAKSKGCYVVGSTSTNEKVELLKTQLGFNDAFNYKEEPSLRDALKRCCPNGIDVYFDNVGGPMLDEVILHMKVHGRIVVSGMVSQYCLDQDKQDGIHNLFHLITRRIRMEAFAEIDNWNIYPMYQEWAKTMLENKTVTYIEDVADGLDNAASALVGIFQGENIGKKVVRVRPN